MKLPLFAMPVWAGLLLAIPAAADEAKTYTLKLHRPPHVGDKAQDRYKITIEQSNKMTSGGKKLKEDAEDLRADFSGITEVLEVSPHGKIQKFTFTVDTFKCQEGVDAELEPFKSGTVITAKLKEDGTVDFTADSQKIDVTAAKVLKGVFELSKDRENEPDDDVIFGTGQPRAAGSEWELNKKESLNSLPPDFPFKVVEKDLSGKVRFAAVKVIDGAEHAVLRVDIDMKPSGVKGLPPEFKPGKVLVKVSLEKLVPIDEKRISPSEKMKMEMHFDGTVESPNGIVSLESFVRQEKENEARPVK